MKSIDPHTSPENPDIKSFADWQSLHHSRRGVVVRVIGYSIATLAALFTLLILVTSLWLFPKAQDYLPRVEKTLEKHLNVEVSIGSVQADWSALRPRLVIGDLTLARQGDEASLHLPKVQAIASWRSILSGSLIFSNLTIESPSLHIERLSATQFNVAGFLIDFQQNAPSRTEETPTTVFPILETISDQGHLEINNGSFTYLDSTVENPKTLFLNHTHARLHNHAIAWSASFFADLTVGAIQTPISFRTKLRKNLMLSAADLHAWHGTAELDIVNLAMAPIATRLGLEDYVQSGHGHTTMRLRFGNMRLNALSLGLDLADLQVRVDGKGPWVQLDLLQGQFSELLDGNNITLASKDLAIKATGRPIRFFGDAEVSGIWKDQSIHDGQASLKHFDLSTVATIAERLPLEDAWRDFLKKLAPRGVIENVEFEWKGPIEKMTRYNGQLNFIGLTAKDSAYVTEGGFALPGFSNLTGAVQFDEKGGSLQLDSRHAVLSFPGIFFEKDLQGTELQAEASWKIKPELDFSFKRLHISNAGAAATVYGGWRAVGGPYGTLEVRGDLHYLKAADTHLYIPIVAGGKGTNDWLKAALLDGIASHGKVDLYGALHRFPFVNERVDGEVFRITAQAEKLTLDYVPTGKKDDHGNWIHGEWPLITDINGTLHFEGMGFVINAQSGKTSGATLRNVFASIPHYIDNDTLLIIRGQGDGNLANMADWVNDSPVSGMIGDVLKDSTASGTGSLDLDLQIPILALHNVKVNGTVHLNHNNITLKNVPPLTDALGKLRFSERGLWSSPLTAKVHGADVRGQINTDDTGRITISVDTDAATLTAVDKIVNLPIVSELLTFSSGTTPAHVEVAVQKGVHIDVTSDLVGIETQLPAPFKKSAEHAEPLHFNMSICQENDKACRSTMRLNIGKLLDIQLDYGFTKRGLTATRGVVALNRPAKMPKNRGMVVLAELPKVDYEEYDPVIEAIIRAVDRDTKIDYNSLTLNSIDIHAKDFKYYDWDFGEVKATAEPKSTNRWGGLIRAQSVEGNYLFTAKHHGSRAHIDADLSRLYLQTSLLVDKVIDAAPKNRQVLPSLDVKVEDLRFNSYELGSVTLAANNYGHGKDSLWKIDEFTLKTPDTTINATGSWNEGAGEKAQTTIEATLTTEDFGAILDRAHLAKTMKDGSGQITAMLNWVGAPTDFAIGKLNGTLASNLYHGQLLQVEPGAARVLSLMSLQSLLRRLTFDFRDVVGQGFAFDTIATKATLNNGVLDTESFELDGPLATVLISGAIDLAKQNQNLHVTVLPDISLGGPTLALSFANPILGVSSFLAQWALQNPLSKLFSLEYSITGSFEEPVVTKIEKNVPETSLEGSQP